MPPKSEIEALYNKPGQSISSLARHYNTTNPTVRNWLVKYDIQRKTHKQASTEANRKKRQNYPNETDFISNYSKMSLKELEVYYGVGQETLYLWLEHYNIPRKTLSDACKDAKQRRKKNLTPSKEDLMETYEKYKNISMCADHFNVSSSFIRKVMKEYEIDTHIPWRSKAEIELYEFCKSLAEDAIHSDKSIINPFELDIVIPSKKIAIEYCGLFWHSQFYGNKNASYHVDKMKRCNDAGYELITVFESDDIERIKNLIQHKIGHGKRLYARNTNVVEISSTDANSFHRKYHIHNTIGGKYHYGLYHENELVMCMSIGTNRFSKNNEYEITRMTSGDISVIGGASKLFQCFLNEVKPKSVMTFADARFGNGSVYTHCGFKYVGLTSPNYWYFHKNNPKLFSRVKYQKHKLSELLTNFDSDKTEYQNMLDNGYDRIWDCGNHKYLHFVG